MGFCRMLWGIKFWFQPNLGSLMVHQFHQDLYLRSSLLFKPHHIFLAFLQKINISLYWQFLCSEYNFCDMPSKCTIYIIYVINSFERYENKMILKSYFCIIVWQIYFFCCVYMYKEVFFLVQCGIPCSEPSITTRLIILPVFDNFFMTKRKWKTLPMQFTKIEIISRQMAQTRIFPSDTYNWSRRLLSKNHSKICN